MPSGLELPAQLLGAAGDDVLLGGGGLDVLDGGPGDNVLIQDIATQGSNAAVSQFAQSSAWIRL